MPTVALFLLGIDRALIARSVRIGLAFAAFMRYLKASPVEKGERDYQSVFASTTAPSKALG